MESVLKEGQIVTGALFNEPMRVETVSLHAGTLNERRVAEDRRDCYWIYVVTNCGKKPMLQEPICDPAKFPWHEVSKIQHYWLEVNAMTQPMQMREKRAAYGKENR